MADQQDRDGRAAAYHAKSNLTGSRHAIEVPSALIQLKVRSGPDFFLDLEHMTEVRADAAQVKLTKRFVFARVMRNGDYQRLRHGGSQATDPPHIIRALAYQSRPKAANVSVMAQQAAACEASRSGIQFNNAVELGMRPFENAERHAFGGIELPRNS